jgi:hypothetical protein
LLWNAWSLSSGIRSLHGIFVMHGAEAMDDVSAEALAVSAFKSDTAALRQLRAYANRGDSTAQD